MSPSPGNTRTPRRRGGVIVGLLALLLTLMGLTSASSASAAPATASAAVAVVSHSSTTVVAAHRSAGAVATVTKAITAKHAPATTTQASSAPVAKSAASPSVVTPAYAQCAHPTLTVGSRGSAVLCLQRLLNGVRSDFGTPLFPHLVEDGRFGSATRSVVIKYQVYRSLNPDGIVGYYTWTALDNY